MTQEMKTLMRGAKRFWKYVSRPGYFVRLMVRYDDWCRERKYM